MLYREAGDFKKSYKEDNHTFPIKFDRYRYYVVLVVAFCVIPFLVNDYWANAIFLPFLIYSIAAIGLNILVGYCGQVSLGTGGFMAVGAYAVYKLMTSFPDVNIIIHIIMKYPRMILLDQLYVILDSVMYDTGNKLSNYRSKHLFHILTLCRGLIRFCHVSHES